MGHSPCQRLEVTRNTGDGEHLVFNLCFAFFVIVNLSWDEILLFKNYKETPLQKSFQRRLEWRQGIPAKEQTSVCLSTLQTALNIHCVPCCVPVSLRKYHPEDFRLQKQRNSKIYSLQLTACSHTHEGKVNFEGVY